MGERGFPAGMDPMEFWTRWYETGSRMWRDVIDGDKEEYLDPYGLYRQWFEGLEEMQRRMMGAAAPDAGEGESGGGGMATPDMQEMWRKWFEAASESWQQGAEAATSMMEIMPRWMAVMEQAQKNMMSAESLPKDPLEFAVRWYNATSGPLSEFVHDLLEREEFLEPASRYLQNYASLYKVFRRRSEEFLSNMQLPTRSDITRVAGLVVALEEKVDRIEDALEDFEYGIEKPATAGELEELEERLDRVEGKLDRLLAALENGSPNGSAVEVKATDAARRKARELGVDLAEVQGTGTDGQITVEDVRKKGEEG